MIYEHINGGLKEDSNSSINPMTINDGANLFYCNAIMKSFYNLVLESQDHKEMQQIVEFT